MDISGSIFDFVNPFCVSIVSILVSQWIYLEAAPISEAVISLVGFNPSFSMDISGSILISETSLSSLGFQS